MSSLALDFTGKHQVEHLLLGNNICGDGLGFAMASLIAEGKSGLSTWYIAGNRLTAEGMRPICDVLSRDRKVQQLWLKRNPLKVEGVSLVADMLRLNSTILVLDLVNTGMLDAGAAILFSALGYSKTSASQSSATSNSTLQHLYLDGNGLSAASAGVISEYLCSGRNRLHTLSIGGNRLGNVGTVLVANGMRADTHVQRLCLASVGMGAAGGEAIAAMLSVNTTVMHVDLGLMKFTAALSEVPNRIGVVGAIALADVLRSHNRTLRSLVLLNNNIHQAGIASFRNALLGEGRTSGDDDVSMIHNTSIVRVELEQMGVPFNELTREEIRLAIRRNYLALDADQKEKANEAINPAHLKNILSVYRVNGSYTN
jgi:Ran GTPase-activating protein (RanGAP) involved in mRNA processing and transport